MNGDNGNGNTLVTQSVKIKKTQKQFIENHSINLSKFVRNCLGIQILAEKHGMKREFCDLSKKLMEKEGVAPKD